MTQPPAPDSIAVILARVEVKLDNALEDQKEQKTVLERHEVALGDHRDQLTKLTADLDTRPRKAVQPAAMWAAFAVAVAALGVLASFLALR